MFKNIFTKGSWIIVGVAAVILLVWAATGFK